MRARTRSAAEEIGRGRILFEQREALLEAFHALEQLQDVEEVWHNLAVDVDVGNNGTMTDEETK